MTREGQGPPDDAPAPPASTRWSGDSQDEDDVLLPPYVRGGGSRPSSPDEAAGRERPAEQEPPEPEYGYPEVGEDDPWGAGESVAGPGAEEASATVEPQLPTGAREEEAADAEYSWDPSEGAGYGEAGALPSLDAGFQAPHPSGPADRLEWLAEVLRREGAAGIRREASSGDGLTSLLAGVIAGYLAGLEE